MAHVQSTSDARRQADYYIGLIDDSVMFDVTVSPQEGPLQMACMNLSPIDARLIAVELLLAAKAVDGVDIFDRA